MRKAIVAVLAVIGLFFCGSAYADLNDGVRVLIEDFEDKDMNVNPTWVLENNRGKSEITVDPLDPYNSVLSINGTGKGHRHYATNLDSKIPWTGFDLSTDFLVSSEYYHPVLQLLNDDGYSIRVRVYSDPTHYIQGRIHKIVIDINGLETEFPLSLSDPIYTWWTIRMWHYSASNKVKCTIYLAESGKKLTEFERDLDLDLLSIPSITKVKIAVEEVDTQYFDNILLKSNYESCSDKLDEKYEEGKQYCITQLSDLDFTG